MPARERIRQCRTIVDVLRLSAEVYGSHPAFCPRRPDGAYDAIAFAEVYETGVALATALIDLGVASKEHVGLLSDHRLEWVYADYGVLLAGAADVPRGADVTVGEIEYILDHADCRVTFVEDEALLAKLAKCRARLPRLATVVMLNPKAAPIQGVLRLTDLLERGRRLRAGGDRRVEERIAAVQPGDLFTIIYTSGTTGQPKGVPLTNANMVSQVRNIPIEIHQTDRFLSILPVWHSYERVALMIAIAFGATTYYTSVRTIADDLKKVRPTLMASAPRLWENLYHKILHNVNQSGPLKKAMFRIAYYFSRRLRHSAYFIEGRRLDLEGRRWWRSLALGIGEGFIYLGLLIPYLIMDGLVTRKLRAVLGGEFRGTISGGGALQKHVDEFFNYIGIPVLEGYGLTESSPVLAVRTWKKRVIGTVGSMWPETEVRIVDLNNGAILYPDPGRPGGGRGLRGEIHARGPQIMPGYYKEPELTARVLKDGWLATGDIGMVTYNDCLKILGRCKETIVLLSGENVEPVPIEGRLCQSRYIDQCMVVGQDQKYLGALIVTKPEYFEAEGVKVATIEELAASPVAERVLNREIRAHVGAETGFRHFEMIHDWRLVAKPFEVNDEMTATYKLKRHVISEKYAGLIADMYHVPRDGANALM